MLRKRSVPGLSNLQTTQFVDPLGKGLESQRFTESVLRRLVGLLGNRLISSEHMQLLLSKINKIKRVIEVFAVVSSMHLHFNGLIGVCRYQVCPNGKLANKGSKFRWEGAMQ